MNREQLAIVKASIKLLDSTLGSMSPKDADRIVGVTVDMLKELLPDED